MSIDSNLLTTVIDLAVKVKDTPYSPGACFIGRGLVKNPTGAGDDNVAGLSRELRVTDRRTLHGSLEIPSDINDSAKIEKTAFPQSEIQVFAGNKQRGRESVRLALDLIVAHKAGQ